jgi:16S rRNA (guanine527-N7)-methyltransferase
LTAIRDPAEAWRVHVEQALEAVSVLRELDGGIVDVGSGGGSPGLPLAAVLPDRPVTLLEANERKVAFLEHAARQFPNVRVIRGRAEEQELETYGAAVAKALAPPAVALEWSLPLAAVGGAAIVYVGAGVRPDDVAVAAARLGGGRPERRGGLLVVFKVHPTPPGFPRRPGIARKRPLS